MKHFNKPSSTDDYFKGIIRSGEIVKVEANNEYNEEKNGKINVIKNDMYKYWHSINDSSLKQYLDITFYNSFVKVTSYMYSTGNNGRFFSKTWGLNCSTNSVDWITIDDHREESLINASKQQVIFDTKVIAKCRTLRFFFPGVDSQNRCYNYLGPVEFYGTIYPHIYSCKMNRLYCKNADHYLLVMLIVLC